MGGRGASTRPGPAPWFRLLSGAAVATLFAQQGAQWQRQSLLAALSRPLVPILERHGVTDGSVSFVDSWRQTDRIARISGTATPAARAAVLAEARRIPGIADARWVTR